LSIKKLLENDNLSDNEFDLVYSKLIREASAFHFTPIAVIKLVLQYLKENNIKKVLDIGSGAGKFCLIGAALSDIEFTGVEHRKSFFDAAQRLKEDSNLSNANFIFADICDVSFDDYDAFYFFNSFQENLYIAERINDEISLNSHLYATYSNYVKMQLDLKPTGTILITYFSFGKEIPESYVLVKAIMSDKIKFWKKAI